MLSILLVSANSTVCTFCRCHRGTARCGQPFLDAATAADTDTLALDLIVGPVVQIAPAQGVGGEAVVGWVVAASQHRPVELGVVAYPDIEALFTGKEPGLLSTPLSKKWVSQISPP